MNAFDPETIEPLGYYVYALLDPREREAGSDGVFYIGKGKGDRCFQHARGINDNSQFDTKFLKLERIRELIQATGSQPNVVVIAHGLSEADAHRIEAILIGRRDGLLNAVRGHNAGDYWLSAAELNARYAKPIAQRDLPVTVLLVSLNGGKNGLPYPAISPDQLASRCLGNWGVKADDARTVRYVLGVYAQLVRCVFKIDETSSGEAVFDLVLPESKGKHRRARFRGSRDFTAEAIWALKRIVSNDGAETLTKFRRQGSWRFLSKN